MQILSQVNFNNYLVIWDAIKLTTAPIFTTKDIRELPFLPIIPLQLKLKCLTSPSPPLLLIEHIRPRTSLLHQVTLHNQAIHLQHPILIQVITQGQIGEVTLEPHQIIPTTLLEAIPQEILATILEEGIPTVTKEEPILTIQDNNKITQILKEVTPVQKETTRVPRGLMEETVDKVEGEIQKVEPTLIIQAHMVLQGIMDQVLQDLQTKVEGTVILLPTMATTEATRDTVIMVSKVKTTTKKIIDYPFKPISILSIYLFLFSKQYCYHIIYIKQIHYQLCLSKFGNLLLYLN